MLIPAMVEDGYDDDFSVAVTAASSVVGPIIPPSVPKMCIRDRYQTTAICSCVKSFLSKKGKPS